MTDNKELKTIEKRFREPFVPKTYEQFILDNQFEQDQKIVKSYQEEVDAHQDINVVKSCGPSSGGIEYELHITGSCPEHPLGLLAKKHKAHGEKLIIRLRHGNFGYYTADSTSGIGGDSSWGSRCGIITSAIAMGGSAVEQGRTREMKISSPYSAEQTKAALNDERILTINGGGAGTDNAQAKHRRTINIIDENLSIWRNRNEFTLIDEDISI